MDNAASGLGQGARWAWDNVSGQAELMRRKISWFHCAALRCIRIFCIGGLTNSSIQFILKKERERTSSRSYHKVIFLRLIVFTEFFSQSRGFSASHCQRRNQGRTDNESRIDVIDHVIKTRLLPVLIIFLCCVLPNLLKSTEDNEPFSAVFTVFFAVMTA